jgi:hypothetical protein
MAKQQAAAAEPKAAKVAKAANAAKPAADKPAAGPREPSQARLQKHYR